MKTINIRKDGFLYSLGEEIANAITHGLGVILAVAGSVLLIIFSALDGSVLKVTSSCIYGASMILLFSMSTLYHALTNKTVKKVFRVFDHTSIFLLIAGTYTPITLVLLKGALGWTMFGIIWTSAILGVVLNSISVERFKIFSIICYVASGWGIIFAIIPVARLLPIVGTIFLILGGIMYTAGLIFYKKKDVLYMHSLWHIMVLAGAVFHYFCILLYII
jgi:hemolysin III